MQTQDTTTYINIQYIFQKIYEFILAIIDFIKHFFVNWDIIKAILSIIAIILITIIIYCLVRIREIQEKDKEVLQKIIVKDPIPTPKNERWSAVQEHMKSDTPSEWRVAIIEADLILEEVIKKIKPRGESMADRLKQIESSDMQTLNQAWEAHKIRNQVAHQGSEFILTKHEAKRVISLYEDVFKEFDVI